MSTKPRKCNKCGQKFSDYSLYKDKVFCNDCLESHLNAMTTCTICKGKIKRKYEYISKDFSSADKKKTFCSSQCYQKMIQDKLDMDELDKWLKEYHKVESLNSRIYMQITQFVNKNNFTYKGILLTLQYLVKEQRKELQIDNISLVSWYYDSAKDSYMKEIALEKKLQQLQEDNFKMFNVIKTKSSVNRQVDKRKDNILITEITFN